MEGIWIKLNHPTFGYEKFKLKVKRTFNLPSDQIQADLRNHPKPHVASIKVGRYVSEDEILEYVKGLYERRGLWRYIINRQKLKIV